jgi:hypothetical protein
MGHTITIQGKIWTACYSLRAAMAVADKYGDIKKALFESGETASERTRARIFVLHELLMAGKAWKEMENGVPADVPPTEEQLLDLIPAAKSGEILEQMIRAINDDENADFDAEDPNGKNLKAT